MLELMKDKPELSQKLVMVLSKEKKKRKAEALV